MAAEVGKPAPDFTLLDQAGNQVSLSDLKGQKSLVVFIPFPFTGGCEGELCAIRDEYAGLTGLGAKVVAITCDTRFTNAKWASEQGFNFPLLSDFWPHGQVTQAYGAFDDQVGAANRWTFVLDADGIVREIVATESRRITREVADYKKALASF